MISPPEPTPYFGENEVKCLIDNLKQSLTLEGDVVECGVYNGYSAYIMGKTIEELAPTKTLYLFDSFSGLPAEYRSPEDTTDNPFTYVGDHSYVIKLMSTLKIHIVVFKGLFCDTFPNFINGSLCFVHLDVDYIKSYKEAFSFVYPKLVSGGTIVVDDCCYTPILNYFNSLFSNLVCERKRQCIIVKDKTVFR